MDYGAMLASVRRRLETLGVTFKITAGQPATESALTRVERQVQIRLPSELREFYQTLGDGLSLFWEADPADSNRPFAGLSVPCLERLAETYTSWRQIALYTPEQAEQYGFPYTKDPELAKRTAARMWHWLPVVTEGNGDQVCLDLSAAGWPVVFDRHDWLDGGTGENGHVLAPNWAAFLREWAGVCFQLPAGLDWPSCFRAGGGVEWDGQCFRAPYRLTAAEL